MSSTAWLQRIAVLTSVSATLIAIFVMSGISMMAEDEKASSFETHLNLVRLRPPPERSDYQIDNEPETDMLKLNVPITDGLCKPTWRSLGENAQRPTWWRKAKIGMWLHWGPQSVGREGDWYAKWIYMPKHAWKNYEHLYRSHADLYGHPSKHGYKDILPLWKAERWDPNELLGLYKRAGARYVLAQALICFLDCIFKSCNLSADQCIV